MIILNHNVASNQPILEIISNPDMTFKIGIVLGLVIGLILARFITSLYYDIKRTKEKW